MVNWGATGDEDHATSCHNKERSYGGRLIESSSGDSAWFVLWDRPDDDAATRRLEDLLLIARPPRLYLSVVAPLGLWKKEFTLFN